METAGTPVMTRRRVWTALDGAGCATLVDLVAGHRWSRRPAGQWVQTEPAPASPALEVARLMAEPDTNSGDVAEVLRGSVAGWIGTLRRALHLARGDLGVTAGRARCVLEVATAVMVVSEALPHHVVVVVDNPDALAASYRVDAFLAARHVESLALAYSADAAEHQGAVRVEASGTGERLALLDELERLRAERRPGLRYLLEPVAPGDVR